MSTESRRAVDADSDVVMPQDWGSGTIDWSGCGEVEVVPGKVSGTPLLKNTRFPADKILDYFVEGNSVEDILDWHELDAWQVQIVYDYCVLHAAERNAPFPVKLSHILGSSEGS
jgi:uncharacterized protein (DUF433 family)